MADVETNAPEKSLDDFFAKRDKKKKKEKGKGKEPAAGPAPVVLKKIKKEKEKSTKNENQEDQIEKVCKLVSLAVVTKHLAIVNESYELTSTLTLV